MFLWVKLIFYLVTTIFNILYWAHHESSLHVFIFTSFVIAMILDYFGGGIINYNSPGFLLFKSYLLGTCLLLIAAFSLWVYDQTSSLI